MNARALRRALLRRAAADQRIREPRWFLRRRAEGQFSVPFWLGLLGLWVDRRNARWLERVVRTHGWPGSSVVGEEASRAAWIIAQHADQRPDVQRRLLEAMREAVGRGDAALRDLAYLEDRVRVNEGRPQLYGTQYGLTGEGFGPHPVEDPDGLDERRAGAGLPSMADYDAHIRERAEEWPA